MTNTPLRLSFGCSPALLDRALSELCTAGAGILNRNRRRNDCVPCGVVRSYEIADKHFTSESWIPDENKSAKADLDSTFLIYTIAFGTLCFNYSVFDVRANNNRTLAFHRRFGAVKTGSDQGNI